MANTDLGVKSAPVISDFSRVYNDYRYKKALVDAVMYHPDHDSKDPPRDVIVPLDDDHLDALEAMMLHPVDQPHHLRMKLEIYKAEDMYIGWRNGDRIASALADDAARIVMTHAELKSRVS